MAQVSKRETQVSEMTCDICMVVRKACDNEGVHFSREGANVRYCNEVLVRVRVECWELRAEAETESV